MTQCQKVFEAIMRSKGHTELGRTATGKYTIQAIQTRWNYFQMGWEMAKVTA